MTPILGIIIVAAILCFVVAARPKNSLKAKAQERYRRDRKAARQRDRVGQR